MLFIWIFALFALCAVCTSTSEEVKRILLNDPSLLDQRLTHLESLVQQQQISLQKQESVIQQQQSLLQQQQSKMSTMENQLLKISSEGNSSAAISSSISLSDKVHIFVILKFGQDHHC